MSQNIAPRIQIMIPSLAGHVLTGKALNNSFGFYTVLKKKTFLFDEDSLDQYSPIEILCEPHIYN